MKSKLDQLKTMTTIVVDTGDIESIKQYTPTDATTNPSLILAAIQKPTYKALMEEAYHYSKQKVHSSDSLINLLIDKLFVNVGVEILKLIPGRVSTELDARLSFDTQGCIDKAHSIIALYKEKGVDSNRVLIKIASTWEGALAAKQLEKEGIHCNMTLLFSLPQAIHCAESQATLISPFVGRILDWYKKHEQVENYEAEKDPGVQSVNEIYRYFKSHQYKTQIMGASFRNKEEILELAGCDLLTISPSLLSELAQTDGSVKRQLDPAQLKNLEIPKIVLDEKKFRWMLNENAMATEKLAEGIRNFAKDAAKLEHTLRQTFQI